MYVARLIFQIHIGRTEKKSFEEQLRLYQAPDMASTYQLAMQSGRMEEITLPQDDHDFVIWEFLGVSDIFEPASFENGMLLDSKTIEPGHDPDYEPYMLQKINHLQKSMLKLEPV